MSWPTLSSATRPRAMWVAAHCLSLPGHWDERWEVLLSCLDHLLVRGTDVLAASRRSDVMGSALAGSLFKAGRQVGQGGGVGGRRPTRGWGENEAACTMTEGY